MNKKLIIASLGLITITAFGLEPVKANAEQGNLTQTEAW